ncbi:MAG: NAD-dependent epimerase/dehydratase family protein [Myxococcota bacterium]
MSELHLVTGGSGYFGCLLVAKLLDAGHRVRVFDLNDADDRPGAVDFVRGDVRDPQALARACRDVAVVHHNVALVPLAKDKQAFWAVNRDGTRNLLEACLESGVRKVVNTSSSAIYGVPAHNPVTEEMAPSPQEDYGRAKLAGEELCGEYARRGLDVSSIRPRTIMGHGRLGIMQILFEWVRLGRNVPVLGRGDNVYQFVHADDLAEACIRAAARPGSRTYNVGADRYGSMRETLEGLVRHAGTGSRVRSVPMRPAVWGMQLTSALGLSPLGPYHALMYGRSMYFDVTRAKTELEWTPRYGNVEMFCESYDWYVAHREAVLAQKGASHHRSAVRQGVLDLVSRLL